MSENIQNPYQKQDHLTLIHSKLRNLKKTVEILENENKVLKVNLIQNNDAIIRCCEQISKTQLYINDMEE